MLLQNSFTPFHVNLQCKLILFPILAFLLMTLASPSEGTEALDTIPTEMQMEVMSNLKDRVEDPVKHSNVKLRFAPKGENQKVDVVVKMSSKMASELASKASADIAEQVATAVVAKSLSQMADRMKAAFSFGNMFSARSSLDDKNATESLNYSMVVDNAFRKFRHSSDLQNIVSSAIESIVTSVVGSHRRLHDESEVADEGSRKKDLANSVAMRSYLDDSSLDADASAIEKGNIEEEHFGSNKHARQLTRSNIENAVQKTGEGVDLGMNDAERIVKPLPQFQKARSLRILPIVEKGREKSSEYFLVDNFPQNSTDIPRANKASSNKISSSIDSQPSVVEKGNLSNFSDDIPAKRIGMKIGWGQRRVIGGETTFPELYEFLLALELWNDLVCGASIISAYWAITAAHCVDDLDSRFGLMLRGGSSHRGEGGRLFQVAEVHCHKDFNAKKYLNDICLLRSERRFTVDGKLLPIVSLPHPMMNVPPNTKMTLLGWGATSENGNLSDRLQKVIVPVMSSKTCKKIYGTHIDPERMLCAGYIEGKKDACQADSGGPLMYGSVIYGIISFGEGCGRPNRPGIYTRVSFYSRWITTYAKV